MASNCRVSEPVRSAILCCSASASRTDAQPALGDPHPLLAVGQVVHRVGAQRVAQVVQHRVVGGGRAVLDPARAEVVLRRGRCAGSTARSRRACGLRWLKFFGTLHPRQRASPASGSRSEPSRPAHLSSVSTSGRGSARSVMPGSRTTASPCRRPDGTRMTSPGRSAASASAASIRRLACESRDSSFSRSAICRRSCAYCADVAAVGVHLRGEPRGVLLVPGRRPGQPDDGPVGLELGEGGGQQLAGPRPAEGADQVDRHVVARPERRLQRERAGAGQPGDHRRVHARRPDDDGVPLDVDAAAARPGR